MKKNVVIGKKKSLSTKRVKSIVLCAMLCFSMASQGQVDSINANDISFNLGAKLQTGSWKGDNGTGPDFRSQKSALRLSAGVQKGRWYGGISIMGSEYAFDSVSPDPVLIDASLVPTNPVIERGELDLLLGYYFWPRVSLFLGVKSYAHKWQRIDYSIEYGGLAFGLAGYKPLSDRWTFFGSMAFVPMTIKANNNTVGDSNGVTTELGVLYRIAPQVKTSISLKGQHQENTFDSGDRQTHSIGGLVLGIYYDFSV